MKRLWPVFAVTFISIVSPITSWGGTITYVGVPSTQSDSNCGINRDHGYTTAVDGGNTRGTDRSLNGITLYSLSGAGQNSAAADNCTVNALSGALTDVGLTSKNIAADGTVRDILSDMVLNNAGGDNSQIEVVLDPESLEPGSTYDLRVYICSSSGQNRQVNLAFFGDGQTGTETGFFNEDDARTSVGGFGAAAQVYYVNYRYTWDGDSTPGITITQKFGGAPFCLYALTNELVEGGGASAGNAGGDASSGAVAQGGGEEQAAGDGGDNNLTTGQVDQESDQVGVESDDFYGSESLNSHGRWVKLSKWGTCWQPTDVASGWCPYTNGSWKECDDCGWTFVSDEPWAWACYHYGRWAKVSMGCGWAWVPGKVWAPSWCSWRQGKDESCVGWAPLPPEAGCDVDVGISAWVDQTCDIGPECYTFVNIRDFGSDSYFGCGCIYERWRNPTVIIDTFNCTNICYGRHVNIYCGGPDWNRCNQRIRQLGGKECGQVHVNRYDNPNKLGGKWTKHEGNQLGLVSPRINGNARNHPKIAESAGTDKIDHGWKGIKDKKQEQQVRDHIAQENKGKNPRNAPAKLPDGVAQKRKSQQSGHTAQNAGQGGGTNLHPGKGRGQGQALQGGTNQAQGGAGGGDQHPGKGGRRKGQGQLAGGNEAGGSNAPGGGNAQGGGFDQHPGRNRGATQGGKAGRGQQQLGGGNQQGGQQQGGNQVAGGGGGNGPRHPGQSFNKQKNAGGGSGTGGVTQGGAGGNNAAGNANAGGGAQHGKGQGKNRGGGQGQLTNQQGAGGQAGQANATGQGSGTEGTKGRRQQGFKGAKAQGSGGQRLKGQGQNQAQNQAQAQGAAQGGGGARGTKGRHQQGFTGAKAQGSGGQQLTAQSQGHQNAAQSGGGGAGKHHRQQQTGGGGQAQAQSGGGGQGQQQQQQQQLRQQQMQQQRQQQRQQGGGKRKKGQGTPPPG